MLRVLLLIASEFADGSFQIYLEQEQKISLKKRYVRVCVHIILTLRVHVRMYYICGVLISLSLSLSLSLQPSQGKEGGFVVRNSSRENMYTLSIW